MRTIGEDEMADYIEQGAQERYKARMERLISSVAIAERRDPAYSPPPTIQDEINVYYHFRDGGTL